MSTIPPSMPPPQPVAVKKVSPLVWILVGLGVFCLLIFATVIAAGFFFVHKANQAGLNPDQMRRNPGMATVRLMAALNPDIEIISYDDDKGQVSVRDKKSGKTYFVNFEDAKKGKFVFQEGGKSPVTLTTSSDGDNGALEIKSPDGTVKIGGGTAAKVPAWIPDYPSSTPIGAFSAQNGDGTSGSYQFKTKDPVEKIAKFYEEGFKSQGLRTTSTMSNADGKTAGGMVSGEQGNKSAVVLVGAENGETSVSVTYKSKK
jgi:hypothetical protein